MTGTPDPNDVAVGARVRMKREALGHSQADLARAIRLTFQQVQKYETGANRISASRLVAIARFLQVTAASLLGEVPDTPASRQDLLVMPGAVDLLKAYNAIQSAEHRRGLLALARSLDPGKAG